MNVLDKVISYVNPQAGLKRELARSQANVLRKFTNTGYSESGASTKKKSMKGWNSLSSSPEEDIDLNLFVLRNRCRDLYNSPLGRSAIQTTRTNVIGTGLKLKSRIDYEYLGLSAEEADEWEKNAEREFELWAESVHCDACKLNNFYELQQLAQLAWLQSGDTFALLKQAQPLPYMPYGLRVHIIEADRVSTPNTVNNVVSNGIFAIEGKSSNGNKIISGVEIDSDGAVVAYHISNRYPQSFYIWNDNGAIKWTRVEAFGALTGRRNILHLMESERPEQRRGVPFLAPVIEPLKQMTRYTEAELMAAVISGMFTVFIKSDGASSDIPIGSMTNEEDTVVETNDNAIEIAPGAVNVLAPGESVEVANPGRPNANFDGFMNSLTRYVGAALEIPQELLQKAFQSSYSAARAALLEAWKMFRMRRVWMGNDFCQPIYEEWLSQAIAMGRIKAPGFFDDPVIKKAWCGAEWNGPAPGQLDPLKEINAAEKRINNGISTREQETMEINGGNFDRNIQQSKREQSLMKDAGLIEPDIPLKGGENVNG